MTHDNLGFMNKTWVWIIIKQPIWVRIYERSQEKWIYERPQYLNNENFNNLSFTTECKGGSTINLFRINKIHLAQSVQGVIKKLGLVSPRSHKKKLSLVSPVSPNKLGSVSPGCHKKTWFCQSKESQKNLA